ncbi:MAG: hypothetical protein ABIP39_13495 [Polyangiaceae bacterium]
MRRSLLISICAVVALAGALGGAGVLAACDTTAVAPTISPVTGIIIRSEQLVVGKGCGLGATQVFKYAAIVINSDGVPVAGSTYDCFADGTFVNLAATDGGNFSFDVKVAAFNAAAYDAQAAAIEDAAGRADVAALASLKATWTTDCTASQQQDIEVLAVCAPLAVPGAGTPSTAAIRLPTDFFVVSDGGVVECGTYDTVSAVANFNGTMLDAGTVSCPSPLVLSPVVAPADYTLQVNVALDAAPFGSATCQGQTSPGLALPPTCPALH